MQGYSAYAYTVSENAAGAVKENEHQSLNHSQLSNFTDNILNNKPEGDNDMIQPLKSTSMSYTEQFMSDHSSSTKEHDEEMCDDEAAKKMNEYYFSRI